MINRKVVLKRLYNVSQKKQNPETMGKTVVGCLTTFILYFMKYDYYAFE